MMEYTSKSPKPMALVDNKPLIWHIMKHYQYYGYNDFILLLGYKSDVIKNYFMNYNWINGSFVIDNRNNQSHIKLLGKGEDWRITFLETGENTMTGGRIKQAESYIEEDGCFLTYGDGLSDINIKELLDFHKQKNKLATVTGIKKESQFGFINVEEDIAISFEEKPQMDKVINGGFFVLEKEAFRYLDDDEQCVFEKKPLQNLAADRELAVYQHKGYWAAADTVKDLDVMSQQLKLQKPKWYSSQK